MSRARNNAEDALARVQYDLDKELHGWQMPGARDTMEEQRMYKSERENGVFEYEWHKLSEVPNRFTNANKESQRQFVALYDASGTVCACCAICLPTLRGAPVPLAHATCAHALALAAAAASGATWHAVIIRDRARTAVDKSLANIQAAAIAAAAAGVMAAAVAAKAQQQAQGRLAAALGSVHTVIAQLELGREYTPQYIAAFDEQQVRYIDLPELTSVDLQGTFY